MKPTFTAVAIATALLMAAQAFAQSEIAPRASVSVLGGSSSSEDFTGAMLGGSMTFDVNDRVAVEGEAAYLDRGAGVDAVSASGSLLLNLLPAHRRIVPYAAVGGGLYRTRSISTAATCLDPWARSFRRAPQSARHPEAAWASVQVRASDPHRHLSRRHGRVHRCRSDACILRPAAWSDGGAGPGCLEGARVHRSGGDGWRRREIPSEAIG